MSDLRADGSIAEPLVAALITPPGRSALAAVAVRGDGAAAAVARCLQSTSETLLRRTTSGRLWVRRWGDTSGEPVVIYVRGPSDVEVHCHGGSIPAEIILRDLELAGAARTTPADLARSYCAGAIEAEALVALAQATTLRAAEILLGQLHGSLTRALRTVQSSLAQGDLPDAQRRLSDLLARSAVGLHLVEPWRVAIVGRPNVGKSSLLNAIVGFNRAIVHPTPGTTRDLVTAQTAIDGWPVELVDSAGIREGGDAIEVAGIERSRQAIESSDVQIVVVDRSQPLAPADHAIIRLCCPPSLRTGAVSAQPLIVANKADLPAVWDSVDAATDLVVVSASAGTGIGDLVTRLATRLVPNPPTPDDAVPFTERQVDLLQDAEQYARDGATERAGKVLGNLLGSP